ncbi:MAG: hypothetical protein AB7V77_03015 [Candidatus Woesearchaeota archaeon]
MILNQKELKKEFDYLLKQYELDDKLREEIIISTRNITKLSKQAIYSVHRDELKQAEKLILNVEEEIKKSNKVIDKAEIYLINNFKSGIQEYVEAKLYFAYITKNIVITRNDLKLIKNIPYETYLESLSDFTGELVKKSVTLATNNKLEEVLKIKETIEEIYGYLLKFDLRSGELRKKYESIKYNLNKIESIIYDLSMKIK